MINQELFNFFFEKYSISISEKDIKDITEIINNNCHNNSNINIAESIFNFYNENRNKMTLALKFSKARESSIKKRIKEFGEEKVKEVIIIASKSSFMNGVNKDTWCANIDWIFTPSNFIKILEGNYNNRINEQQNKPTIQQPRRNR